MKKVFVLLMTVFLLGFYLIGFSAEKAPNFKTIDSRGNIVDSKDYLGKNPTILIFWAQWCVYCRIELQRLNKLHAKYYKKGLRILAINRDNPDERRKMNDYLKDLDPLFPIIVKPMRIPYDYKALTIPFLVGVDANGNIIERGFSLEHIKTAIDLMIKKL